MPAVFALLLALTLASFSWSAAPAYSLATVVNSATGVSGDLAPNALVSIYGTDLSYNTVSSSAGTGTLPKNLGGVTVSVGGVQANLFYVSPKQVNLLVPASLVPGKMTLYLNREGIVGPVLNVVLKETVPGFFADENSVVIATHLDGSRILPASPAAAEEIVVLYAAGLGRTNPDPDDGRPVTRAAPIVHTYDLALLFHGAPIDPARILYAGATPGFAGLYQINLRTPVTDVENPEIRVFIGLQSSPSYLKLPYRLQ